uniref:Uncharacterized protein n=1 Tax=Fagus sylvatica TaxID=28930 RepID=A0A2N9IGQ8_FAGSY
MALAAIVLISLMISMPGYEAGRSILHGKEQDLMKKNSEVPPSQPLQYLCRPPPPTNPPTTTTTTTGNTPPSTINQEAFTSGQFNLSPSPRRKLFKGIVPPSTINQESFTSGQFNLSPSPRRKLVKGYVPPSATNSRTHNPASTRSHNAAPFKH